AVLGRRSAADDDRRQSRRGERPHRRGAGRSGSGRASRHRGIRQHQRRPHAQRRQLPQDSTPLMPIRYVTVGAVLLAFVLAAILVRIAHTVIHRALDTLDIVGPENREAVHARANQLIRSLTLLAYSIAAVASISLALDRFGVSEPQWNPRQLLHWALTHGINLLVILVGPFIVVGTANLGIDHRQFKLSRRHVSSDLEWQRRAATLGGILTSLVTATVGFVAILMMLRELSIDVMPILTGAGIAG